MGSCATAEPVRVTRCRELTVGLHEVVCVGPSFFLPPLRTTLGLPPWPLSLVGSSQVAHTLPSPRPIKHPEGVLGGEGMLGILGIHVFQWTLGMGYYGSEQLQGQVPRSSL